MTSTRRLVAWAGAHLQAFGLSLFFVTLAMATYWFVAFSIPGQRQATMDGWRRDLDVRAEIRAEALKRYFIDGLADAETLAAYPTALQVLATQSAGAKGPAADLKELFGDFVRIHGVLGVVLSDAEGKPCVKSRDFVLDAACLAPASEVLGSGTPATGLHLHAAFGPILTFSAPVRLANGDVRGVLVLAVDPRQWLYPLLAQPLAGNYTGEAFLVGRDGADILFLSPLRNHPGTPLSFRRPFAESGLAARAALEGSEILGPYVDYRGVSVLAGGRRIPPSPWALVVKIDEKEALAAFRKDMLQKGVFWGALLLALFAAAVGFWRALGARSEVELARSEARSLALVQDVLDQSSSLVYIHDTEGRLLLGNRAFQSVVGVPGETIAGQKREVFMPAQIAAEHRKNDLEVINQRRSIAVEETNEEPDGRHVYSTVKFPLFDAQGDVYAVAGMSTDITAGKRAVEDLAKSEAYFRSLIENSLDLTAVLDPSGCVRYTSPSVERLLGYKPEELAGRSVFELIHPGDLVNAEARFHQVLAEGTRMETIEIRFKHRDGSWRTISVIGKSLLPETGMTGLILNARDLTERLQLEAQFQQAQKMEAVGRLAGGVAHDFNNLLTVIQGYGELLTATLADDSERRENLNEIVKAAERAAGLTRQLLAFSRQQVLEMRVIDLGAVMADIEKMLKRLIGEDIEVGVVKPPALGHVKADPGQIEQVVLNLAVNARDAMPGGGRLTVELGEADLDAPLAAARDAIPAGRYVVISMSDTGSGMDAETLGHIFEPFFTTKERGKGTGLGLATVYGIVRQTGGYVAVETAPGAGTTFRIYLPRCDERIVSGIRPSVRPRRGTETVLLVEDELAVRALTKLVLERQGYTVLVAENGLAALDVVARDPRPIHVLLTDIVMPGMNGRELASRVAALRPSIKVVFMSGYTAEVLTSLDVKEGKAFISKPFTERALAVKLREVLDTKPG